MRAFLHNNENYINYEQIGKTCYQSLKRMSCAYRYSLFMTSILTLWQPKSHLMLQSKNFFPFFWFVFVNRSKTAGRTITKLGTTYHHTEVVVLMGQ